MAFVRQTQMGAGADEVRAYRQPQDRQGARSPVPPSLLGPPTRLSNNMPFAALHEFRKWQILLQKSFWGDERKF